MTAQDDICTDGGGPNSLDIGQPCELGTDCTDCGDRRLPPSAPPPLPPVLTDEAAEVYGDSSITLHDLYYWVSEAYGVNYTNNKGTGVTPRFDVPGIAERCDDTPDIVLRFDSLFAGSSRQQLVCNPCLYPSPPPPTGRLLEQAADGAREHDPAEARREEDRARAPEASTELSAFPPERESHRRLLEEVRIVTQSDPQTLSFTVHSAHVTGTWYRISMSPGSKLMYASLELSGVRLDPEGVYSLGSASVSYVHRAPSLPGSAERPALRYLNGQREDGGGCFDGLGTPQMEQHFLSTTLNIYQQCHSRPFLGCCTEAEAYLWLPAFLAPEDEPLYIRRGSYYTSMQGQNVPTHLVDADIPAFEKGINDESPPPPSHSPPPMPPVDDPECAQNTVVDFGEIVAAEAALAGRTSALGAATKLPIMLSNSENCHPPSPPPPSPAPSVSPPNPATPSVSSPPTATPSASPTSTATPPASPPPSSPPSKEKDDVSATVPISVTMGGSALILALIAGSLSAKCCFSGFGAGGARRERRERRKRPETDAVSAVSTPLLNKISSTPSMPFLSAKA